MRKKIEMLKSSLLYAAMLSALLAVLTIGMGKLNPVWAQGFPCQSPVVGVQPGASTDCSVPSLTYNIQGGQALGSLAETIPIGSVAYASLGNATTNVAGTIFSVVVLIPSDFTVNAINILNGATVGTDKGIAILFNSAGVPIANSALAGTTTSGANAFQAYSLVTPITVQGPGRYIIGYQPNGTTDIIRTIAANTFLRRAASQTGTFGTIPTITVPSGITANVGPIAFLN